MPVPTAAWGDTPILMADGRHKPLAELEVGDVIYGTERRGALSALRRTPRCSTHWSTVKPAYRVTLEDGTELVASGDHRFLSDRGWKHVTGCEQGSGRRPHLTLNNKLHRRGQVRRRPPRTRPDYRRGYLCGVIRGDGHLGSYSYRARRDGRTVTSIASGSRSPTWRRFAAPGATSRTSGRRDHDGVRVSPATAAARGDAGRSGPQSRDKVVAISDLVEWPAVAGRRLVQGVPRRDLRCRGKPRRRASESRTPTTRSSAGSRSRLRRLGFRFVVEVGTGPNGCRYVRLLGGLRGEAALLPHGRSRPSPASATIEGIGDQVRRRAQGVVAIEPLGIELPLYDITTGTGDFIANGVVSHNCFARPTHTYLDFDAGRDFEREIVVKVNTPEVARAELMRPSWKREHVALGHQHRSVPVGREEVRAAAGRLGGDARLAHAQLGADQVAAAAARHRAVQADPQLRRATSRSRRSTRRPGAPASRTRRTRASGSRRSPSSTAPASPTGVLIAPLMPGINDSPAQVEKILELCAEAGAVSIGGICLHLRGEVREIFMDWLRSYRPDLVPRYESLYARGAYAPQGRARAPVAAGARRPAGDRAAARPGRRRRFGRRGRRWRPRRRSSASLF